MDIEDAITFLSILSKSYKLNVNDEAFDDIEKKDFERISNAIDVVLDELDKKQNITICGKTPEEAYKILSGIELERQLEIKVTMDNLSVIVEKINKELEKQIQEQFQEQINNITKRK